MPRANRHFLPGHIWHITHRCHKKEFLLKFDKDRDAWVSWLFEAKKRFKVKIFNYIVTSNHIHLLLMDSEGRSNIPDAMQLIAGRTAQAFNSRKKRKGAFWEDRYHATAVSHDNHLIQCMIYIDMNMVRAGVVKHPGDWKQSGYHEIFEEKKRYSILDIDELKEILDFKTLKDFRSQYNNLINDSLIKNNIKRQAYWSEKIAVGDNAFVEKFKEDLGIKSKFKKINLLENVSCINEEEACFYTKDYADNLFFWK